MLRAVRGAAKSICQGPWANDREDAVQEGLLAVWLEGVTTPQRAYTVAWRAILDAQRVLYGRASYTHGDGIVRPAAARYTGWLNTGPIDAPIGGTDGLTLADAQGSEDPGYEAVEDAEDVADARKRIAAALDRMTPRQRDVIARRAQGETLAAIGRSLGVTESRVCQIQAQARRKARPESPCGTSQP